MEIVLDAGADDLITDGGTCVIHGAPGDFVAIKQALEAAKVPLVDASVTQIPKTTVELTKVVEAHKVIRMLDMLEDHDDVQNVSANYTMGDEIARQLAMEP